jgi:hypothetical protein
VTYNLRNGYKVVTRKMDDDATQFETRNPEDEVISTVTLGREAARDLVTDLRVAAGLGRI